MYSVYEDQNKQQRTKSTTSHLENPAPLVSGRNWVVHHWCTQQNALLRPINIPTNVNFCEGRHKKTLSYLKPNCDDDRIVFLKDKVIVEMKIENSTYFIAYSIKNAFFLLHLLIDRQNGCWTVVYNALFIFILLIGKYFDLLIESATNSYTDSFAIYFVSLNFVGWQFDPANSVAVSFLFIQNW